MSLVVICSPGERPQGMDAAIAQAYAYEGFRQNFLSRHPTGVVMTEYEYIGRTTFAGLGGSPVLFTGKPLISQLITVMSDAFRRFVKFADFRKPDGIGLVEIGRSVKVELLEVTTEKNEENNAAASKQMRDKIDKLKNTVVPSLNPSFPVEIAGTPWKPSGYQITCPSIPTKDRDIARWICYLPTLRSNPPAGVILYEVHRLQNPFQSVSIPDFSQQTKDNILKEFAKARVNRLGSADIGENFPKTAPMSSSEINNIVAVIGMGLTIAGVATACLGSIADPVPGDEIVVCGFAVKVVQASIARGAPSF